MLSLPEVNYFNNWRELITVWVSRLLGTKCRQNVCLMMMTEWMNRETLGDLYKQPQEVIIMHLISLTNTQRWGGGQWHNMLNAVFKFSDHISDAEETLLTQHINLLNFYRQEFCQLNVISVILEQNANLSCLRGKEIKKKNPVHLHENWIRLTRCTAIFTR